ncbi:LarC family nickel insertion protein [Blautia hansenii]|uniref:LarC family nickel insertion protein n=1 Tax=Blautia hansenii TaxID=1322 RepID=UPI0039845F15
MKKALYFDCASGISGDMSVAALLDLGADKKMLLDTLDSLKLSGYKIEISELEKSGICACDFNVLLDKKHENHDHDMEYLHGKDCGHNHIEHEHKDAHQHNTHTHHHEHRSLPDILSILENSSMTAGAKAMASKIFEILAEGEARAHRVPKEQVHFHEVGAVDSIVDIAAFAICMDFLGYKEVFLPVLREGQGTIRCQHGILPIPVPATSNIVCTHKLPLSILPVQGELVTPTGAAIAAAITTSYTLPEIFQINKIGVGAGKREYEVPGILRVMEIQY